MSENKNAPTAPADPDAAPNPGAGWYVSRSGTFLATTALAVLTGTPRWEQAGEYHPASDGSAMIRSVQGTPGQPGSAGERQPDKIEAGFSAEIWARLFSADEHAGELTGYDQLSKVRELITNRQQAGYRITAITLEGHASDEDDATDAQGNPTGGLGQPSEKNRRLGETRAEAFRPLLREDLGEHNIDGVPPLVVVPPVEDMVTPAERGHIEQLAAKFGYSEPVRLIQDYNRQQNVPPEAEKYLDEVLARERKVVIRVESEKIGQAGTPGTPGTPGSQESGKTTSTDAIDLGIPLALFMLIPAYRRRRDDSEPVDSTDRPETDVIPATGMATEILPAAAIPTGTASTRILPAGSMERGVMKSAKIDTAVMPTDKLVARSQTPATFPVRRKDAAYHERSQTPRSVRPVTRSVQPFVTKRPRPQNMHGTRGLNHHLERSKGGDRRGKTSRIKV